MKIAIDIDNTLCNTTEALCDQYNEYTGCQFAPNLIETYRIEDWVHPRHKTLVAALFNDTAMWKRVELLPNCEDVIRDLWEDGHDIYFATSTNIKNLNAKRKWLHKEFPFIDIEQNLIGIKEKQLLNVDVLIDDCGEYMQGGAYKGILLDYAWNKKSKGDYIRVYDWLEIKEVITQLAKNKKKGDVDNGNNT